MPDAPTLAGSAGSLFGVWASGVGSQTDRRAEGLRREKSDHFLNLTSGVSITDGLLDYVSFILKSYFLALGSAVRFSPAVVLFL